MMRKPKAMIVAGVMSGTSVDGVDVALVRVSPSREPGGVPKVKLRGSSSFPYPEEVREAVLRAAAGEMQVREVSRLHWRLGEIYADCVEEACADAGVRTVGSADTPPFPKSERMGHPILGLIGMHGQTVYHEAPVATWQIGEAAVVRERLGVPVVSDFRPADLAAGGQGAPLVPMLDYCMFRSKTRNRVLLNLGGIANMTAIPAGGGLEDVIAFDSGPANMVVDALMSRAYGRNFDCGGQTAGRGEVLDGVVKQVLEDAYFSAPPPKSCGREQFGREFVDRLYGLCAAAGGNKPDAIATATEITARSVLEAFTQFVAPRLARRGTDVIAAGGGTRNAHLMRRLGEGFAALGAKLVPIDEMGMVSQAKEAAAFALLAWLSWHGLTGNVPAATGARRAVVLGKVTC